MPNFSIRNDLEIITEQLCECSTERMLDRLPPSRCRSHRRAPATALQIPPPTAPPRTAITGPAGVTTNA